ncbi:SDR family NAD(P)-dependent oxidoreductase [Heyndrickxia faecalis]
MGKAIAALYAKEGAKVVASDLNLEGVQQTVAEIEAAGGTALAVQANVASEEDVQHLMDTAVKEYGTLDILINNAGIMDNMVPAGDLTDALWKRCLLSTQPGRCVRSANHSRSLLKKETASLSMSLLSAG